jgi:16S rRNA (guanine527-N7)-methyltransferase
MIISVRTQCGAAMHAGGSSPSGGVPGLTERHYSASMTREQLLAAGFELSEDEHARLARFVALLLDENTRINLTGTRTADELWPRHICDSLALLPLIGEWQPRRVLDLGTGGGLPGIPLACVCPDVHVTLLDATQKKLAALGRIVAALELPNVRCLWGRAELLAHDPLERETYDAVITRAVGPLRVSLEYAAGFVKPNGAAWCYLSERGVAEELGPAENAANRCRLTLRETRAYTLPEPHGTRVFAVYHKDRPLLASLPRRSGNIRSQPL